MRKIYFFASTAALGLIAWSIQYFGETNLPPLLPSVRYVILALYANLFASYALFVSDARIESEKLGGWAWYALIGAGLCSMWPVFSGDLMEYLIRGRMLGIYHVSPYVAVPNDFPNDLLRPYSIWITNPDSYGPLSVYLQTPPAMLFPSSISGAIWSYKLIVLAFLFGAVFFFRMIVDHLQPPNAGRLWATFAYCPLLAVTAFIDGHNDIIMMSFSIASLYFLLKKRYGWAFFLWTCAFLIKYMVVLHLPFMVLYAVQNKWQEKGSFPGLFVVRQLALNLLLIAAFFAPIWGGEGTFLAILKQKGAFYTNTIPFLFYLAAQKLGLPADQDVFKAFFLSGFGLLYAWGLYKCWEAARRGDTLSYLRITALAYLAFYAALPSPLGYWYLCWALFWIVLARWPGGFALVVLYSAVGVLAFYKRPNFLAALAVVLYMAWLGVSSYFTRKAVRK